MAGSDIKQFIAVGSWFSLGQALSRGASSAAEGVMNVIGEDLTGPRVIRLSFSPISDGETKTIEIVATEVTELMQATKALKESEASLQSVSVRLLQIQDEERRRLARDLHDTTGQELSVIIMTLDRLGRDLAGSAGDRSKTALNSAEGLRKIENQIRTLSYVLHPPLLDEMGLRAALQWYVEGFSKRTGIKIAVDIPDELPRFSIEKETALFRVIQEGLTNVFRHSGSNQARLRLCMKASTIEASIGDDGKGLSTEALSAKPKSGVGIQSMKGRLEMVGGSFEMHSSSRGTCVVATVPLEGYEMLGGPGESGARTGDERAISAKWRKRILIADDHHVARRGIRSLFDSEPDLEICGEAADGFEALERAKELKPDLVILDLSMPHMGGLTAANRIRSAGLATRILVYTSHSYPQLEQTVRAAGCDGYLAKTDASHDLIRATRTVLAGGKFYRAEMLKAQSA
jgi:signal transduction histidine kinase/AmiR/NasT family two-component response regulator